MLFPGFPWISLKHEQYELPLRWIHIGAGMSTLVKIGCGAVHTPTADGSYPISANFLKGYQMRAHARIG